MIFPPETAPTRVHRCTTCSKAYSTQSHLRRHEATHSGRQELTCPSCHRQFSRRDLARRHAQKCSTPGHEIILPYMKRGKKRTSCDQCSQRKLLCDTKKPCIRCHSGGVTCTYKLMNVTCSHATSQSNIKLHQVHSEIVPAQASAIGIGGRISIEFLLNFTDPSGYRPSAAIAAEVTDSNTVEVDNAHYASPYYPGQSFNNLALCDTDDWHPYLTPGGVHENAFSSTGDYLASEEEGFSSLGIRARDIVSKLIAQQSLMQERDANTQSAFDTLLADAVFTVGNIRRFVRGFFRYFHNQFPILHLATWNYETVSVPLLLTVILFGSMSYSPSDISIATRQFLDVAEAYVFDRLASRQQRHETPVEEELELLQAGLLFLILLNNNSDLTTRRRLRVQRAPSLIAAVRASGLFSYRRKHLITSMNRLDWKLFIIDEVRVRLGIWTFLADSTVALFFNSPPQVAISEMIGDLPCRYNLFKAETAVDFESIALTEPPVSPTATLSGLVRSLLFPSRSILPAQLDRYVTAPNMLLLVCALQSVVTTSRMNFLALASTDVILDALNRWKSLWDTMRHDDANALVLSEGFEKHAEEYWWLTRTILEIGQSGDQSCRYMHPTPSDSIGDLNDFVRRYKERTSYINDENV